MIGIKWGSEEQRLADSLVKQATSFRESNPVKAIELIRHAIETFFDTRYYFKLALYLCDLEKFDEAVSELKFLLEKYTYQGFYDLKNMNRCAVYSHMALVQEKKGDSKMYLVYTMLSAFNKIIGLALQGRRSEMEWILENGLLSDVSQRKFKKHVEKSGISEDFILLKANGFIIANKGKLLRICEIYEDTDFFDVSLRCVIEDMPGFRDEQYLSLNIEFVAHYESFDESHLAF